jgi:peptidoglycan/xylan/chitin deacetylase (PgdA/CDA1 family)
MNLRENFRKTLLGGYCAASQPYRKWVKSRLVAAGKVPILVLFYHRIADDRASPMTHSNRLFRRQIHWLMRHCEMISLEEAQRRIRTGFNDRLAASITFDDGYAENCDQALPLLVAENIPCTYFVSSQIVLEGKRFPHDEQLGCAGRPNTVEQLCWMVDHGIEIGGHTRTHADMGRIDDEHQIFEEVITAGEELQAVIDRPMRYFAFPYGLPNNLNARAFQLAAEHGYEAVCSAYGDYNFPSDDAFHIRRIHVEDMVRLRNWATIDPRRLTPAHSFDYHSQPQESVLLASH